MEGVRSPDLKDTPLRSWGAHSLETLFAPCAKEEPGLGLVGPQAVQEPLR